MEDTFFDRFVQETYGMADSRLCDFSISGGNGPTGAANGTPGSPTNTLIASIALYGLAIGLFGWQLVPPGVSS